VTGTVQVQDVATGAFLLESPFNVSPNGRTEVGNIPHPEGQGMWEVQLAASRFQQANHYLVGAPPFDLDMYRGWMKRLGLMP